MGAVEIPVALFAVALIILAGLFVLALYGIWWEITRPHRHTRARHALGKPERRR